MATHQYGLLSRYSVSLASDAGAKALAAAGQKCIAVISRSLRVGAVESDVVIQTAFNHDFSKY